MRFKDLYVYFNQMEKGEECNATLKEALHFWLWETDLVEKTKNTLNQNQYAGILFIRVLKRERPNAHKSISKLVQLLMDSHGIFIPHMNGVDFLQSTLDFRRLSDVLDGVQQYWGSLIALNVTWAENILTCCTVLLEPFIVYTDLPRDQANLPDAIEDNMGELQLNTVTIKSIMAKLCCMYRSLYMEQHAEVVTDECDISEIVESFHVEAGTDVFFKLSMAMSLKIGQYVEYQNTFSDYFNHISQVVYKHEPDYKRPQPPNLQCVKENPDSAVICLPSINQLYPQVEFVYEDEQFESMSDSTIAKAADPERWRWLLLAGKVYLVNKKSLQMYKASNLRSLIALVVKLFP
jgi:hypothetical protein